MEGRINIINEEMGDYSKLVSEYNAGITQICGQGHGQEDWLGVASLEDFQLLSPVQQDQVLKDTMATMEEQYGAEGGSTACAAIAWLDDSNQLHAKSAHVGDSLAYIVIVNESGFVSVERINKELHNPTKDSKEAQRIIDTKRGLIWNRVNGTLAVSRAIGDRDILTEPTDHIPDIDSLNGKLNSDANAFMIVASDGMKLEDQEIGGIIYQHQKSPQTASYELVSRALQNGSKDDTSVAVIPIRPKMSPIIGDIFDGHGGCKLSNLLGKNFLPTLKANIKLEFEKTPTGKICAKAAADLLNECRKYEGYLQTKLSKEPALTEKLNKKISMVQQLSSTLQADKTVNERIKDFIRLLEEDSKPNGNNHLKLATGTGKQDSKFWKNIGIALGAIGSLGIYAIYRGHKVGSWQFWKSRKEVFKGRIEKHTNKIKPR